MAIAYMLGWWYGQGWSWLLKNIRQSLKAVEETFSVTILLKTWFSPWKQIQTPSSFNRFFQAAIDNLVSRFIGAAVRTLMLLAAFLLTAGIITTGVLILALWPVFPLMVVLLPIMSLAV